MPEFQSIERISKWTGSALSRIESKKPGLDPRLFLHFLQTHAGTSSQAHSMQLMPSLVKRRQGDSYFLFAGFSRRRTPQMLPSTTTLRRISRLLRGPTASIRSIQRREPELSRKAITKLRVALAATGLTDEELDQLDDSEWLIKLNWRRARPDWLRLMEDSGDKAFAVVWRAERRKNPAIAGYDQSRVQFHRQLKAVGRSPAFQRDVPGVVGSSDGRQVWTVKALFDPGTRTVICSAAPVRAAAQLYEPGQPDFCIRVVACVEDDELLEGFEALCRVSRLRQASQRSEPESRPSSHGFRPTEGVLWLQACLTGRTFRELEMLYGQLELLGRSLSRIWRRCDHRYFVERSGKLDTVLERNK